MSDTSATDPAGQMAAMGSELQNGVFGADPADPGTGQGDNTPDSDILREDEPDVEDGVPSGDDPPQLGRPAAAQQSGTGGRGPTELGDRS